VAVTISDNRTILDEADAVTNFNAGAAISTIYAEAGFCISIAYNETTGQLFYNGTTPDLTAAGNKLIYLWSACVATQNSYKEANPNEADSSHAMYLSDGTNNLIIFMAGNDRDVFKHADGQVTFQSFVIDLDYLDTVNTNGDLYALAGSYASFDPTSTTMDIGAHYVTLTKALGGGTNCSLDIIRYGTEGISIIGGTTGDRGTFAEVAAGDRSTANQAGHGLFREYTPGSYGAQGTIKFGTTSTGDSWFDDSGFSVTFEDRLIADDKYKVMALGNTEAGEETHLYLSDGTIASARPGVEVDMSMSGINTLSLDGINFVNLKNPVTFPTDSSSYTHSVANCGFSNVGQIDPGTVDFQFNSITAYDETYASGLGAVVINSGSEVSNWSDNSFVSAGTGHGIYIIASGEYTFTNNSYAGYAAQGGTETDRVVYNNSGGTVTLNVDGGDSPSYRNGASATTVIVNAKNHYLSGLINGSEVTYMKFGTAEDTGTAGETTAGSRNFDDSGKSWSTNQFRGRVLIIETGADAGRYYIYANSATQLNLDTAMTATASTLDYSIQDENDMTEEFHVESVTGNQTQYPYGYVSDSYVDIMIQHVNYEEIVLLDVLLGNSDQTIPIDQKLDANYYNPT
jgi:hypothetical protein